VKTLTSSVAFQDEFGNALTNGSLILSLQQQGTTYLILSGGGQVVSRSFIVNLDSSGKLPAGVSVWASDELSGNPVYRATLCRSAGGITPVGSVTWSISGSSPIDLSTSPQHQ
jgi:phage-related tail protein